MVINAEWDSVDGRGSRSASDGYVTPLALPLRQGISRETNVRQVTVIGFIARRDARPSASAYEVLINGMHVDPLRIRLRYAGA